MKHLALVLYRRPFTGHAHLRILLYTTLTNKRDSRKVCAHTQTHSNVCSHDILCVFAQVSIVANMKNNFCILF